MIITDCINIKKTERNIFRNQNIGEIIRKIRDNIDYLWKGECLE